MRIFMAYPFTGKLTECGTLPKEYIEELNFLKSKLQKIGYKVILAHEREKWGKSILHPDICTKLDFEDIKNSDVVIAYPGNPPSGGVHVELGWASDLKKKIILIQKEGENYSPLIVGLPKVANVTVLRIERDYKVDSLAKLLVEVLKKDVRNEEED